MKKELNEHGIHRISNYESYEVVKDYECPTCHQSSITHQKECSKLVGWTSTPSGFMVCFECPICFEKFRCHGSASNWSNEDEYIQFVVKPLWKLHQKQEKNKMYI